MDEPQLSVSDVRSYLQPLGIAVIELASDTSTAPLAARALYTDVSAIVKSLLFIVDDKPVLVLAAGDRKIDRDRLAKDLGARRARLARPDEVLRITGFPVGGVPPVAHRTKLRTFVDGHLLIHTEVYAAAGAGNAVFAVSPQQLVEMTGGDLSECTS